MKKHIVSSRRVPRGWITPFLTVLVVVSWVISGLLLIQVVFLRNQVHTYEIEIGQLQESISELKKEKLGNETIVIGVTVVDEDDYYLTRKLFEEMVEKDVNGYCTKHGYDLEFKFIIMNNAGSVGWALQNIQYFKEMGIDIVIGHPWSSQCFSSMILVNENDMLLFSPSSSSSQLAIPDDNLLRMCPDDMAQAPVLAEMLWSWGIKACIVINLDCLPWNELYNAFDNEFTKRGGVIMKRIRCDLLYPNRSYAHYLDKAEAAAMEAVAMYGSEHVAVQFIGTGELAWMIDQVEDYPTLYSLYWFGCDGTAKKPLFIDDAPEESSHLKIFSPSPAPAESSNYTSFKERYDELVGFPLDFYQTCKYDTAWIIVKAILEAQTTDVDQLLEVIPDIASKTFGASGWCKLNEAGDRETADYEIWGYGYASGRVRNIRYGLYDSVTGQVSWFTETLGFTPPGLAQ